MQVFFDFVGPDQSSVSLPAQNVLNALRRSVMLHTSVHKIFQVWNFIELHCTSYDCNKLPVHSQSIASFSLINKAFK